MEYDGKLWFMVNLMEYDGILWNMMENYGLWWNMIEHDGICKWAMESVEQWIMRLRKV